MNRLLVLAGLMTLATASQAAVLFSDNFESYAVGSSLSDSTNYNASSDAEFTVVAGGVTGQGVTISTPPLAGNYYAWHDLNFTPTAADSVIRGSVDVKSNGFIPNAGGTTTSFYGTGFYNPAGSAFALFQVQAATAAAGASYRLLAAGDTTYTTGSLTLPIGTTVNLAIQLDTVANTASYYLNNTLITSRPYTLSDAVIGDLDLVASATGYDDGVFDNYRVETVTAVPEPATMAALGLGAAALLRRRRKA